MKKKNKQQFKQQKKQQTTAGPFVDSDDKTHLKKQVNNGNEKAGELVISVKNLSKAFLVPHQKIDSMRSAFVNLFQKNTYEKFDALKNVSFDVHKGDFIGIIGHNGSGKSTLLKCLAGVYQADEGDITINGRISPFLELGIGFNPELSGRDNIYLNATILGLSKEEIDQKYDDIVTFSEIEQFIDQKVKNYSSGMKGRLAFSVSIHANRDILLMDEVLAVGDSRFQDKCLNVFKNYKKEGRTVVLVTHDMGAVREYCDHAFLLHHGEVVIAGDVDKVCDEYIKKNLTAEQRLAREKQERLKKEEEQRQKVIAQQQEKQKKEAERIAKQQEQAKKAEEEKKKVAKITKVEFLDNKGKQKNTFQSGDDITVRVYFNTFKEVQDLNFGIALCSEIGTCIFAVNTIIDNISTKKYKNKKNFTITYKKPLFKAGKYYTHVAIFGKSDTIIYDALGKSDTFTIIAEDAHGIIKLDYYWE